MRSECCSGFPSPGYQSRRLDRHITAATPHHSRCLLSRISWVDFVTLNLSSAVIVAATQAHRQFGQLIRRAFLGKEHFVIQKDGLPVAVILSVAEYTELLREHELHEQDKQARLSRFREIARTIGSEVNRAGVTEEQVTEALQEMRQHIYQSYYGQTP